MLPLGDLMVSGPALLWVAMSELVVLQQPGPVLMSMVLETTEGHVDDWELVRYSSPCCSP